MTYPEIVCTYEGSLEASLVIDVIAILDKGDLIIEGSRIRREDDMS